MGRSWTIDKKGELTTAAKRDKAHKSRVTSIVASGGFLYSASLNGSIKMWDAQVGHRPAQTQGEQGVIHQGQPSIQRVNAVALLLQHSVCFTHARAASWLSCHRSQGMLLSLLPVGEATLPLRYEVKWS